MVSMSMRRLVLAAAVVGITLVSAGCLRVTVEKSVLGSPAPTSFTGYYFCNNDQGLTEAAFPIVVGTASQVLIPRFGPTTCVFSEPESFGARSVVLECVNPPAGVACSYHPTTQSLVVTAPAGTEVLDLTIRVTNDFTPSPTMGT